MAGSGIKAKLLGGFLSSKGLLSDGTHIKVFTLLRLICNWISRSFIFLYYNVIKEHSFVQQGIDNDILEKVK